MIQCLKPYKTLNLCGLVRKVEFLSKLRITGEYFYAKLVVLRHWLWTVGITFWDAQWDISWKNGNIIAVSATEVFSYTFCVSTTSLVAPPMWNTYGNAHFFRLAPNRKFWRFLNTGQNCGCALSTHRTWQSFFVVLGWSLVVKWEDDFFTKFPTSVQNFQSELPNVCHCQ